jgi:nucleoside-diphosphate-sugar epimerase
LAGSNLGVVHEAPRLGDIKHSYADASKATKLLDYKPTKALRDGLREILANSNMPSK